MSVLIGVAGPEDVWLLRRNRWRRHYVPALAFLISFAAKCIIHLLLDVAQGFCPLPLRREIMLRHWIRIRGANVTTGKVGCLTIGKAVKISCTTLSQA